MEMGDDNTFFSESIPVYMHMVKSYTIRGHAQFLKFTWMIINLYLGKCYTRWFLISVIDGDTL